MPPKRRKLSVDEPEHSGREVKKQVIEITATSAESDTALGDDGGEKFAEPTKLKSSGESSADSKVKDDAPKPTRISERLIIKRNRLGDVEEPEIPSPAPIKTTPRKSKPAKQGKQKKPKRRPWAQWSIRDKRLFFIGLGEYGKNFEAISNKISHAAKMKGGPLKDKMQVRYFYYRCWAKVSKLIHVKDPDVKMKTQELYGLINYGVLRKHVKETDPQFEKCLNDLIQNGVTTYTVKNVRGKRAKVGKKRLKLRTPVCTYLKKLNRIEDKTLESMSQKIPHHITLELTPKTSKAWAKVQGLSQNPRVRFKLTSNRTLESVFKYLEQKWTPPRVRIKKDKFGAEEEEQEEELMCYLHPSSKVKPVTFIPLEQKKVDVTFASYRENILPTLLKPKKPKSSKESDKPVDQQKDKAAEEGLEGGSAGEKSASEGESVEQKINCESGESDKSSASKEKNACMTGNAPGAFANLLAAAAPDMATYCNSDIASVAQTGGQNILADTPVGPTPPTVLLEDENAMFPDSSTFSPPSCSSTQTLKPSVIISSPSSSSSSLPAPAASAMSSPPAGRKKSSKRSVSSDEGLVLQDNCDNSAAVAAENSVSPAKTDCTESLQELKEDSEKEVARLTTLLTDGFSMQTASTVTLLHLSLILGRASVIKLEYDWKEKKPLKNQLPPLLCQATTQMSNLLRRLCNLAVLELTEYSTGSEKAGDQNKPPGKNVPCSLCGREATPKAKSKRQLQAERRENTRDIAIMTDPQKLDLPPLTQVFHPNTVLATGGRTFVAGPPAQGALQHVNGPDPVFRVPFAPAYKTITSKEEQQRLEEQQRIQQQAKAIMQQAPSPRNRLLKRRTLTAKRKTPPIIVQRTLLPKVETGQMVAYVQNPVGQSGSRPLIVNVGGDNLVKIGQPLVNIVSTSTPQSKTPSSDQTKDASSIKSCDILTLATQRAEIDANSVVSPEKFGSVPAAITVGSLDIKPEVGLFSQLSLVTTTATTTSSVNMVPPELVSPALSSQGDISMSDFDISMSSVTGSNMGPDAGDKFLDMVLQNSEQGFAGLIDTPKKSNPSTESYQPTLTDATTSFDPSVLRTPPHAGISSSSFTRPSSIYPSPIKLGISDHSWMAGDMSFGSILGESSPFKKTPEKDPQKSSFSSSSPSTSNYAVFFDGVSLDAPNNGSIVLNTPSSTGGMSFRSILGESSPFKKTPEKDPEKSSASSSLPSTSSYAVFFDSASSDAPDNGSIVLNPPSTMSELSLSSLLGDPSFKKEDAGGISPPITVTSATTAAKSNGQNAGGAIFSDGPPQLFSEASQDSFARLDMDGALQGMVNDSSLDMVSKFESLAAQITQRQDQETTNGGEGQEKLAAGTSKLEHIIRIESPSTAS